MGLTVDLGLGLVVNVPPEVEGAEDHGAAIEAFVAKAHADAGKSADYDRYVKERDAFHGARDAALQAGASPDEALAAGQKALAALSAKKTSRTLEG